MPVPKNDRGTTSVVATTVTPKPKIKISLTRSSGSAWTSTVKLSVDSGPCEQSSTAGKATVTGAYAGQSGVARVVDNVNSFLSGIRASFRQENV